MLAVPQSQCSVADNTTDVQFCALSACRRLQHYCVHSTTEDLAVAADSDSSNALQANLCSAARQKREHVHLAAPKSQQAVQGPSSH
jgi:hypothetical protein